MASQYRSTHLQISYATTARHFAAGYSRRGWGPGGQHDKANLGLASTFGLALVTATIPNAAGGGVEARNSLTAACCRINLELFKWLAQRRI